MHSRATTLLVGAAGAALVIVGSFLWRNLAPMPELGRHSARTLSNRRAVVTDRNGEVLAEGPRAQRRYPYGPLFFHALGSSRDRGLNSSGAVERTHDHRLSPEERPQLFYFFPQGHPEPPAVKTTLDLALQRAADEGLGDRRGAVVVHDATNGEVYAMVSHPTLDPNTALRSEIDGSREGELVNRVLAGNYPPGSVAKLISAEALVGHADVSFVCTGVVIAGGREVRCAGPHGLVPGLRRAFAVSCNGWFLERAKNDLLPSEFLDLAQRFGFMLPKDSAGKNTLKGGQLVIGQAGLLLTPIQGARLAAAAVNGGILPEPLLVAGKAPGEEHRVLAPGHADRLAALMEAVVKEGTGRRLADVARGGARLGLKTGTAEVAGSGNVDWAVGFYAPPRGGPIAFAVVVEDARGTASEVCLPIVRGLISAFRSTQRYRAGH